MRNNWLPIPFSFFSTELIVNTNNQLFGYFNFFLSLSYFFFQIKYFYNLFLFFPPILNGEENPREFDWWTCAFKIAINAKYMILTRGRCQGKMVTTQIVIFYVRNTWKIWLYNAVIILLLFIACIMSVFITMLGKREKKKRKGKS